MISKSSSRNATRENYDRLSRWYDFFAGSEKHFTEAGLQMLDIHAGERVLEIGCGTGHSLVWLAKAAGESGSVWGLDISLGMLKVTQAHLRKAGSRNVCLCLADATSPPLLPGCFDIVFLSFTLELFSAEDISILLEKCRALLRSKGRIGLVSLKKEAGLVTRIYEWFHARMPSVIDCRPILPGRVLSEAGFEVTTSLVRTMWGLPVEIIVAKKP